MLNDEIYDFSDYIDAHPGGADAILDVCGNDGSDVFNAVHTLAMLKDFDDNLVGKLV